MTNSNNGGTADRIGSMSRAWDFVVFEADDGHREDGCELVLFGHERLGRRVEAGEEHAALVGQTGNEVAREAEQIAALLGRVEEQPEVQHRSDVVQRELERRDDAEVASAAAQRPEQVGVLARRTRAALVRRR